MNALLKRLPILILQPHNRCNCRCVMCDIWKITEELEITAEELERHLGDIEGLGVQWTVFSGGEPLMHTDLFRLAAMLRARGIRTTILSSGLLLSRRAAAIVAGIDDVIVSLDGPGAIHDDIRGIPGAFRLLAEGVQAIHLLAPEYPIAARCTVQTRNAGHLRATVDAARALGLRSISFLAADLNSSAFNRPLAWPDTKKAAVSPELAILDQELEAMIAAYPDDGFIQETPEKLRRIARHFRAPVAPRCNAPWVSAVVEANGDLRPCFFHPPVGNLAGGGLREVLNSPRAIAFRENLDIATHPICRQCVCSLYVS